MKVSHYRSECNHGTVVSQCRCPDPNKVVSIVPCPWDCPQQPKEQTIMSEEFIAIPYSDRRIMTVIKSSTDIVAMQEEVKQWTMEKGWWNDGRTFGDEIALAHSELSEALEAFRDRKFESWCEVPIHNDDKSRPKPAGVGSELADTVIRLLHTCAAHDIDLGGEIRAKMDYNWTRTHRHGGKRL